MSLMLAAVLVIVIPDTSASRRRVGRWRLRLKMQSMSGRHFPGATAFPMWGHRPPPLRAGQWEARTRLRSARFPGSMVPHRRSPAVGPAVREQEALRGRTGAKPTPQFPLTTVVIPFRLDGLTCGSQVTWPS